MLRVIVEFLPQGDMNKREVLGVITLTNDGTGTPETGNYVARIFKWKKGAGKLWREGRVRGFPRQKLESYDLLFRALREMVGARNVEPKPKREKTR